MFFFGLLAFCFLATIITMISDGRAELLLPLFIMAGMAVFGFFTMKKQLFDLVDKVWDDGDTLVIRNKGKEERIVLSNIMSVSGTRFTGPERITLTLREPCSFGKEIAFLPPFRRLPFFTRHPLVRELIERIDQVKNAK